VGTHSNITLANAATLVDGAVYDITFNGWDNLGNAAATVTSTSVTYDVTTAAVVGYSADNVIPSEQIVQADDGSGIINIEFKVKDDVAGSFTLTAFEYSVDDGSTWNAPANGDASGCLSGQWENYGSYTSSTSFAAGNAYSFTFNTKHSDVSGLDDVEQSDRPPVLVQVTDKEENSFERV